MPGVLKVSAVDADPTAIETLIAILRGVDRPESILTWKRATKACIYWKALRPAMFH